MKTRIRKFNVLALVSLAGTIVGIVSLVFGAEHNVAFGPTRLPQLVGQAASAR